MYADIFQKLGMAKNEAQIYETLLREGELSVGAISQKSRVHRRNVYDSLHRLLEKGLVFEILERQENRYQAVDPRKLGELVEEKSQLLRGVMPELEKLYRATPHQQEVFIYRGIEGWKNYMRDILRVGEDFYCINGKGAWMDPRVMPFFPSFIKEMRRKRIKCFHLFDREVGANNHPVLKYVGKQFKFFPQGYEAPASIDIFGSHVNIISNIHLGGLEQEFSFTVIVNPPIADAFRVWFRCMWDFLPGESGGRTKGGKQ